MVNWVKFSVNWVKLSVNWVKIQSWRVCSEIGKTRFCGNWRLAVSLESKAPDKAKRAHGEKNSADFEGAELWVSTVLPQLLLEYTPENMYNADETGLYYRATPDSSLCYKYEQLRGSKRAMERVTIHVLLCANMTGKINWNF